MRVISKAEKGLADQGLPAAEKNALCIRWLLALQ